MLCGLLKKVERKGDDISLSFEVDHGPVTITFPYDRSCEFLLSEPLHAQSHFIYEHTSRQGFFPHEDMTINQYRLYRMRKNGDVYMEDKTPVVFLEIADEKVDISKLT